MSRRKMISEIDNRLINEIAELWVEYGGDKDGFYLCSDNIAMAIEDLLRDQFNEKNQNNV